MLIKEDIQNRKFTDISYLKLDNTGCNFLDVEALKIYDPVAIYMVNGQIKTEDDVVNLYLKSQIDEKSLRRASCINNSMPVDLADYIVELSHNPYN